ncbi:MAG: glycosyl transferase [Patescibacteria group bacterium]|nr:MAG: glycosyl transferase [Patescibacteria group bacterium]
MGQPKIAFVHDYLLHYGGAEKVLEAMLELYPNSPIYTSIYNPERLSETINSKKIICPKNRLYQKFPKYLSFMMPLVFENFDLREYDIIISDSSAWSKGVLTKPEQLHISYIHTPPRFLYKYSVESTKRSAWYFKPFVSVLDSLLRVWDHAAGQRPNYLIANSEEVRSRIKKFYGRDAQVIYPPVEIDLNSHNKVADEKLKATLDKPYFLIVSRLVAYKNIDRVIEAFKNLETNLLIIGTGNEEEKLKSLAGPNVKFLGKLDEVGKSVLMENCLGVINAVQDEDFGIVPVEAMAHGKPVMAHKSGGHLETVVEGVNGVFFNSLDPVVLADSIKKFEKEIRDNRFDSLEIKNLAKKFSKKRFQSEMKNFVETKWNEHKSKNA